MRPGAANALVDVEGLRVGHAADARVRTGTTVLVGDAPFAAAVHVMGGAPGTRETDLLAPDKTVEAVDALVLSGGSAFGLGAAEGVTAGLRAMGRGFAVGDARVPIVPAAILFDLLNGGAKDWAASPYPALGRAALEAAGADGRVGSVGAGFGATTASLRGGLGTASCVLDDGATVGALVAVNALGAATDGAGRFLAATLPEDGAPGGGAADAGAAPRLPALEGASTTIGIVATDADLSKAQLQRMAVAAHDGLARALWPAHTPFDGDLIFAVSTRARPAGADAALLLGHAAAVATARAIARGIHAADPAPEGMPPAWRDRHG